MNSNDPPNPSINPCDEHGFASQCGLYLLGELAGDDRETFELQLATSPDLADKLVRQADLLLAIADVRGDLSRPVRLPDQSVAPVTLRGAWISVFIAVAACFVLAVTGIQLRDSSSTEDVLIAQAWADSISGRQATDSDLNFADLSLIDSVLDPADESGADVSLSGESSFDWMCVAVAAGSSSPGQAHMSESNDES
ncbi:anti-sigma factor [Rubripirellula reticaptiva]|uniref:Uncharacterized protein n=1 Tax=Rubripirellula reticaptiva TaxID=2528013 RepID=A0A5C6F9W0_9BACT|nr:hypothetical protein [Rubripirellula reticaptiva]TWU57247.1 hypothetical protein Poly59_01540 [Rubripirellula reticaptiva]